MNPKSDESLLITAEGYAERCRELERLRIDVRRNLVDQLREARNDGDLAENPALQDLLAEQEQLESRIALLEAQLAVATIVAPAADGRAGIGSVVRVRDSTGAMFEYELVGPLEADASKGRVSTAAPVGQALVGQRAQARVDVATPKGRLTLEVVSVRPRTAAREAA